MSAIIVASYRVTNPEGFQDYPPAAQATLAAHGAEVIAVDLESEGLEGDTYPCTVVLKFESKEAAKAWYNSPEYKEAAPLRHDNSEGTMVLINGTD